MSTETPDTPSEPADLVAERELRLLAYASEAPESLELACPAGLTAEEASELRLSFGLEHPTLAGWLAQRAS